MWNIVSEVQHLAKWNHLMILNQQDNVGYWLSQQMWVKYCDAHIHSNFTVKETAGLECKFIETVVTFYTHCSALDMRIFAQSC